MLVDTTDALRVVVRARGYDEAVVRERKRFQRVLHSCRVSGARTAGAAYAGR